MTENEPSMSSVNIRVPSDVWDSLDGENRSKIARDALKNHSDIKRNARDVLKYSRQYAEALEQKKEVEATMRVKRQMVFEELTQRGFDQYVLPDGTPDSMSQFEEMLFLSSEQAKEYCGHGHDFEDIVRYVRGDMSEQGHQMQRAVAEWVVETVQDELED